ncbi:MAG TPA: sulfatase-like hydrolase/transferase [Actinomycetes bacterium]|nr:sulfatase-like hydrolase/transferase [Actinomycetes bacterium]
MASDALEEAAEAPSRSGAARRLAGGFPHRLLELLALTGFVITQPLLDLTGRAPDFFLLHGLGRGGILLLVVVIAMLSPLLLWAAGEIAGLLTRGRLRGLSHLAMVTGLLVLLALETGKQLLPLRGKRLALAALLAGALAGLVYHRWSGLKLWLRYLAPAPLVFVLLFATTSPASNLILPERQAAPSAVPALTSPARPLPPVVLIFLDEFPLKSLLDSHGQVDERVYPSFAEVAAHSTWYRNATGIGGWTPFALPSMLTGRYPDKSMLGATPDVKVFPDNLFTLFGHYYNLKAFETIAQLCPVGRCGQAGSSSGLRAVVEDTARLYKQITWPLGDPPTGPKARKQGPTAYFANLKQSQLARVDDFLRSIGAHDPQPSLYFLHLLLPHAPWKYLPDGRTYNPSSLGTPVKPGSVWPTPVQQLNQKRHLLQLAYTDRVIGRIMDRLKEQGLYDRSLVVLTADHGEGFTPGDRNRALGPRNAADLMWVPLFIKAPHQSSGRVDDRNWEHVDLLPTIADIAGLGIPWKVDGFSQVGAPRRFRTYKIFYNHPGSPLRRPGPPNFQKVLHGVTDTLVRAHQHGERGFYQFGATADWIYRSPRQVGRVGGGPLRTTIRDWKAFQTVDPKAPVVPSMIVGDVTSGTPPAGSVMVVAVNGQIGATSGFYPAKQGRQPRTFAMLVPPFLFRAGPGPPQIQLYLATRSDGSYRLQPVAIAG